MPKVKQRKVGASYVVTIPMQMVKEPSVEYEVTQQVNSGILYTPIIAGKPERERLLDRFSAEVEKNREAIEAGNFVTQNELKARYGLSD